LPIFDVLCYDHFWRKDGPFCFLSHMI
jgi:hypothetical protein